MQPHRKEKRQEECAIKGADVRERGEEENSGKIQSE
jgi:hypothetical protein